MAPGGLGPLNFSERFAPRFFHSRTFHGKSHSSAGILVVAFEVHSLALVLCFFSNERSFMLVQASAASALASADVIMRRLENDGKTAVIVSVEGAAVGVIAVADTDKEVCASLLSSFRTWVMFLRLKCG